MNEKVISDLASNGWTVCDDLFASTLCSDLRAQIEADFLAGQLQKAGVGRGANYRVDAQLRGDFIRWLDPSDLSPAILTAKKIIEDFRLQINRSLFLGLNDYEGHLTKYPISNGYAKHVDRFTDKSNRTLSIVVYLNQQWQSEYGGQLRIFSKENPEEAAAEILPTQGRMIAFISDEIYHQVLPNNQPRYSLTGWYLR